MIVFALSNDSFCAVMQYLNPGLMEASIFPALDRLHRSEKGGDDFSSVLQIRFSEKATKIERHLPQGLDITYLVTSKL